MAKLEWERNGSNVYEHGVDRCVLYVDGLPAVPWNGITEIVERPVGAEPRPYYIDGVKYQNLSTLEEFECSLSAFYSPPEFDECDGAYTLANGLLAYQQTRKPFALSYRTNLGDDGYKIHVVYNATALPSESAYQSQSDTPEAMTLSWDISTKATSMLYPNARPSAKITIASNEVHPITLANLENTLYGSANTVPRMPTVRELFNIFAMDDRVTVIMHGDGTFTVSGPDSMVKMVDAYTYEIASPAAQSEGQDFYKINYF